MTDSFRPSPEQARLFGELASLLRSHPNAFIQTAAWFARDFSLAAIDAREEATRLPEERAFIEARLREGWILHESKDPSGYMKRLLRAVQFLVEIDDSVLPKSERMEHYRRLILIGALMTDPDFHSEAPEIARVLDMDRPHWQLSVGASDEIALDRLWARSVVFDPENRGYHPFQPLLERALNAIAEIPKASDGASRGATSDKRRRIRGEAPKGWIYRKDAAAKYELARSTLHDLIKKLPPEALRDDPLSAQGLIREVALRDLLRKTSRLKE